MGTLLAQIWHSTNGVGRTHGRSLCNQSLQIVCDCGYPSSIQLDSEEIVTVYYTYESHGPFQALPGQLMGLHAEVIKYKASGLP